MKKLGHTGYRRRGMAGVAPKWSRTNYKTHDKTHGAPHCANTGGSDPAKCFRAARRTKTWVASRPCQCFVRVLQRVC